MIGNTPLYYAALGKNVERIKILLDNGADANISNHRGQKPVNVSTIKEIQSLLASATHVEHETTSLGQTTSDGYLSEEV